MKEKLNLPPSYKAELWLYNKDRFLDRSHQPFLHSHDEIELNLVTSGRGVYILNSQRVDLAPNAILWLFPEQEHLLVERSPDFEMWIVILRQEYLEEICTDANSQVLLECDPAGDFFRSLSTSQFQKLHILCKEALAVRGSVSLFNISVGYILLSAWAIYQAAGSAGMVSPIHPAIDRATKMIIDGMGKDDLPHLAQQVGLGQTTLSRLFKQQMGISITAFRNRCRVEQFIDLYGDGQSRTMLDAALEAGFGSYAQFFRVFKQIMGGTPAAYRRNLYAGD
jgi:AraC-like DNA-binding protein